MESLSRKLVRKPEDLAKDFSALRWRRDVAALLEIPDSYLIYYLYRMPISHRYTTFQIRKKGGGARTISAPTKSLKIVQAKLAQVLQAVYRPTPSAHGFILDRSIVSNAEGHKKCLHVFNADIKDFFPTINYGRVRGLFVAAPYNLPPAVATVLAQICTHKGALPQGAPTSPVISNMICSSMDSKLKGLARTHRCRYTRYADDITFSKLNNKFPPAISTLSMVGAHIAGADLTRIVEKSGFKINESKVRLQTRRNRKVVTGLVVNTKVNVPRKFIRNLRATIHAYKRYGKDKAQLLFSTKFDKPQRVAAGTSPQLIDVLRGKIEFVGMVKGDDDPVYVNLQRRYAEINPGYRSKIKSETFRTSSDLYTITEPGRRGGTGQIYKVIDRSGKTWAVKLFDPTTDMTEKKKRFRHEIGFCLKNAHPNIVTVHDHGERGAGGDAMPFYVMPYYPDTLRGLMTAGLSPERSLKFFLQILEGVRNAHKQGVSHRDLKPENILYDAAADQILVADFGIAHFSAEYIIEPVHSKGMRTGNFDYSAPEQRQRGGIVDSRADIFVLGMMLNELFTSKKPLGSDYRTITEICPEFGFLDPVVRGMLQSDQNKRPVDVTSIIEDIQHRQAVHFRWKRLRTGLAMLRRWLTIR